MAKGDKEAKGDKPAKAGKSEKAPKAEKSVKAPKVPGEKKGEQCLYLRYEFLKSCFTVVLRSRHFLGGSASLRSRSRLRLRRNWVGFSCSSYRQKKDAPGGSGSRQLNM